MPDSFSLLESFTSNASGFRFCFWDHRKHQVSTQHIYLYEFKHPVLLDNLDSKKWFDLSRNSTIFGAVQSYFQKRTLVAYASSQGKTQTSVRRMDKLLWLILVSFWIFVLSFFVSWRSCRKDFFLCFNIYSVGVLNSSCCIKKKSFSSFQKKKASPHICWKRTMLIPWEVSCTSVAPRSSMATDADALMICEAKTSAFMWTSDYFHLVEFGGVVPFSR